jgi:toxin ParE1/3/4
VRSAPNWRIRLSAAAERDFASILEWTNERFGARQARAYRDALEDGIGALGDGPDVPGAKRRDDIAAGIWSLHVARHHRRGRHFLLCRVTDQRAIEIVRILHDSMDIARHLPRWEADP